MVADKDEHPIFRTFVYMNINILFLFFSLAVITQGLISFLYSRKIIGFILSNNLIISSIIIIVTSILFTYFKYFYKKDINSYVEKYKYHRLNRYFINLILYLVPLILFIVGPIISVFLFGGTSFGNEIKGILN